MKLHLGAGTDIKKGWVNHDIAQLEGIDVVHNLNNYPWPWSNSSIEEVVMIDLLEHLPDTPKVMKELYRICKLGATIKIRVPFGCSSAFIGDPTHINMFNHITFQFFDQSTTFGKYRSYYADVNFKILAFKFHIVPYFPNYSLKGLIFLPPNNRGLFRKWFFRDYYIESTSLMRILLFLNSIFNNLIDNLYVELKKVEIPK